MPLKRVTFDLATSLLVPFLRDPNRALRKVGVNFLPLAYHIVTDAHARHIAHLHRYKSLARFEQELEFLVRHFRPVEIDQVVDTIHGRARNTHPSFLLTFDDGLREVGEIIAPLLLAKGIPAIIFVNPDFVDNKSLFYRHKASLIIDQLRTSERGSEAKAVSSVLNKHALDGPIERALLNVGYREQEILDEIAAAIDLDFRDFLDSERPYLTISELEDLSKSGFAIGAHSRSHPQYSEITLDEQISETLDSLSFVRKHFNPKFLFFAFPFHDLAVRMVVFDQMWEAGVDVSFGTNGFRSDSLDRNIQRIVVDDPSLSLDQEIVRRCAKLIVLRLLGKGVITRE